jgi:hypothetical protein
MFADDTFCLKSGHNLPELTVAEKKHDRSVKKINF